MSFSYKFDDKNLTPVQLLENIRTQSFSGEKIDFVFSNTNIQKMFNYLEEISGIDFDVVPNIQNLATTIFSRMIHT